MQGIGSTSKTDKDIIPRFFIAIKRNIMKIEIHIGKLIKSKMDEGGRKANWLAKQINCDKSNISKMYKRKYIDIEQLIQISIILDFDFFALYSQFIIEQIKRKNDKEK